MNFKTFKSRLNYPYKKSSIKYLLRNPSLVLGLFDSLKKVYFPKKVESILGSPIISCLHEFLPEKFYCHLKESKLSDRDGVQIMLYLIIRKYRPEIVIETGVASGKSSAFTLCAMHENSKGHLYSIDLPFPEAAIKTENKDKGMTYLLGDGQVHRAGKGGSVGWLVPEYLKERWTLTLGDAKKELPELLNKVGTVSIFFHDSLHTYEHMMFEFEAAWPHIADGGLLLSHNVLWNDAFLEFSKKVGSKPSIYYSFGVIKKS